MQRLLFDSLSWLDIKLEDDIPNYLEATGQKESDFASHEALRQATSQWELEKTQEDWEIFLDLLREEEPNHCLVTGYFMAWDGKREGGNVYTDLATAVQEVILDDSRIKISITDEGVLVLDETHHDAPVNGNHYEFRILNSRGESFLEDHKTGDFGYGRRELCETLKNDKYSRNVDYRIFGFESLEKALEEDK